MGNPYAPQGAKQWLFEFADEIGWTLGKHNLTIGGEVDKVYFDGNWELIQNGMYTFTGKFTSDHTTNLVGGSDVADFLLGYPASASGAKGTTLGHFRQWNVMPYVQDNWRVSKKLTLNLGLRYDFLQSPKDALGLTNIYDYTTNTNRKGSYNQDWGTIAPRVGFAYSVSQNTVVHGGYGIYYSPMMYAELLFTLANPPNWVLQSPTYDLINPVPVTDTFATNPPLSFVNPWTTAIDMPTPRVQQWNLSVQRSFGSNWIATVSYLGCLFAHSHYRLNPNQADVPSDPLHPSPIASRRPYPWVGDIYSAQNVGWGNYHGFQAEVERRYSYGLSLLASYVWSKALDTGSADNGVLVDGRNPGRQYGLSDYNMAHVFKFSSAYQLPLGAGRRISGSNNWFNHQVIGGWQMSGIFSVVSGTPFSVMSTDNSMTGAYHPNFANQVCNPNENAPHTIQKWFNTSCFVQPPLGQLGNAGRNDVKPPSQTSLDISLFKQFRLMEGKDLEFRSDFLNALNHRLLYLNSYFGSNVASASYGALSVQGARVIQLSLKFRF